MWRGEQFLAIFVRGYRVLRINSKHGIAPSIERRKKKKNKVWKEGQGCVRFRQKKATSLNSQGAKGKTDWRGNRKSLLAEGCFTEHMVTVRNKRTRKGSSLEKPTSQKKGEQGFPDGTEGVIAKRAGNETSFWRRRAGIRRAHPRGGEAPWLLSGSIDEKLRRGERGSKA